MSNEFSIGPLLWKRIFAVLTTSTWWSQGPESFLAQLDSEQDGPEVIWNLEMRQRLLDHLTSELESYVKFRAADPLALYIHVPKAPLTYPELAGKSLCPSPNSPDTPVTYDFQGCIFD